MAKKSTTKSAAKAKTTAAPPRPAPAKPKRASTVRAADATAASDLAGQTSGTGVSPVIAASASKAEAAIAVGKRAPSTGNPKAASATPQSVAPVIREDKPAMLTSSTRRASAARTKPQAGDAVTSSATGAGATTTPRRTIRCYLCGRVQEVSLKTLSTTCPACHKAIKVEDVVVKSYVPVNDLQTCGRITVTKKGRVVAKRVQAGDGLTCEGTVEAILEVAGPIELGPKASWKGKELRTPSLVVEEGAALDGRVCVPWDPNAGADDRA